MAKILIAEDERDIRDLIQFTLEFAGFNVTTAKNGLEALEMAKSSIPDLILLDVRMPIMTGYEACENIKKDENLNHIPVVFLSAKGQDHEIQQGIELGAAAYILKPFSNDELIEKVNRIISENTR